MKDRGYYDGFGGAYLPEILVATFDELVETFQMAKNDSGFWQEYVDIMSTYSCRPTPLTFAENLTKHFGGARIYIKREDLNHTGAHKINNAIGQGLLAKRMGKSKVIAETGASSMKDMGGVMKVVLARAAGRADGAEHRVEHGLLRRLDGVLRIAGGTQSDPGVVEERVISLADQRQHQHILPDLDHWRREFAHRVRQAGHIVVRALQLLQLLLQDLRQSLAQDPYNN